MIIIPGGNVGLVGDGGNNEVATFTDTSNIQGEANLTFDGTALTIASGSIQVRTIDYSDGDNAITIADGGGTTFAAAVDLGSNTLTSTGSMQIRTIDYSDGDLAMTIADGGTVTFDDYVGMGGTATAFAAAAGLAIKKNGDHLYLEQTNADNGWIIQTSDSDGHLHFERRGEGGSPSNTELMVLSLTGDLSLKGTTPTITIGDTGDEDAMIIWDTDHDFYMGSGDTESGFTFGSGSTMGSEQIWTAGSNVINFVGSSGVFVNDDINWYWGTGADYRMKYDTSNTRWVMWSNDIDGGGSNADIIRIEDGQTTIDANTTWDANIFDIYDDAMLLASSISPTADAYDFGKGIFKRGKEALIEAGVLKRYEDDGWIGYNDQRMAALLAGGIYQTRWLVDEMKEKIFELEDKVKALGG